LSNLIKVKPVSVLGEYVGSRIPLIFVNAHNEDTRFIEDEVSVLIQQKLASEVYVRDVSNNISAFPAHVLPGAKPDSAKKSDDFTIDGDLQTLEWFIKDPLKEEDRNTRKPSMIDAGPSEKSVLIIFDLFRFVNDRAPVLRLLKKAVAHLFSKNRSIVIVANNIDAIPSELSGIAPLVNFPAPGPEYIRAQVRAAGRFFAAPVDRDNPDKWLLLDPIVEDEIVMLLKGFRSIEIISILRRAARRNLARQKSKPGTPPGFDMELVRQSKADSTQKTASINIIVPKSFEPGKLSGSRLVGGADQIKAWFRIQRDLFSDDARRDNIDVPRGALVFGPGGTGKDHLVRCMADEIGWTNIEADLGAAKGPLQGQSHSGFRNILATAEEHSPCFLTISEFEKMFAGGMSKGSAASDAGTSTEIYATFLNWMQNRTAPVFVWALTNSIDEIPQPALRAQRFDRVWFMDMPNAFECREILAVHLLRTGNLTRDLDLNTLALQASSAGYTGAELRSVVNEALILRRIESKDRGHKLPLTMDHLNTSMKLVNPTGGYRKKEVQQLQQYARDNCYPKANSLSEDLTTPSPLLVNLGDQQEPTSEPEAPVKKAGRRTATPTTPKQLATSIL